MSVSGRLLILLSLATFSELEVTAQTGKTATPKDSLDQRGKRPSFRPTDRHGDPFSNTNNPSLLLKDPSSLKLDVAIDTGMNYTIYEKIGTLNYRPTSSMTFREFQQYQEKQYLKDYWKTRSRALDGESAVKSRGLIPKIYISPVLDRIFGGNYVELVPRGFVTLDFGGMWQKINNPTLPTRQQRNGGFEFDQQMNLSVNGKVGEKMSVNANFDNNNSFDFQNNMKVEYTGFKEDILKKLEIGNVSLPLNNTLIQGAQNLFGIKAQMQFGRLNVTTVASTQRGRASTIEIPAGNSGQGRPFEIIASNYDENRHFFLGHFFRDHYRRWIANLPQVTSGVNITRIEVYILNRNNDTQTLRNVVGLMDLGEPVRIYNSAVQSNGPLLSNDNNANTLFNSLKSLFPNPSSRNADGVNPILENLFNGDNNNGTDFEKITSARKLSSTEFTFQPQLGYITLVRKLQNDEALAVAYEYTYQGQVYKVGELSEDYSNLKDDEVVFLKLLRPRKIAVRDSQKKIIPTWDLMMKNIYSLNVNQLTPQGFQLRIIYRDDRTGIDNPQLQENINARNRQLIEIFGLDKLNPVNDPQPDGNFDFVEKITINTQTGLIIFPYLEPFSQALREAFKGEPTETTLVQKYSYDTLYHTTKADAELFSTKNKFFIKGQYSAGASREILIPGFGVSQGSVKVYAGGTPLLEGSQYTVDYTFGKVTILDESILNSGKKISVNYEQSDPFVSQTRTLIGTRWDYRLSEDVNLGSTLLYYNERPMISRYQIGNEPARNVQYGFDVNMNKKSRVLTKIIDAIPLLQTKELSTVNFNGEFAQLLPGTSNVISGDGTAYLDDFENTATPYSLINWTTWKISSVPQTDDNRFDLSNRGLNDVKAGYKRAKLAWYQIDNNFYRSTGQIRPEIFDSDRLNHYMRAVGPQEIFPQRQLNQAVFFEPVLDLAYYPYERGPYNYSSDLDANGFLKNPETNWGGITTAIKTEVDFDKSNIEYIEFWLLDPFIDLSNGNGIIKDGIFNKSNRTGGKLIFQLGSLSEDVMRDGKHAFENGLPPDGNLTGGGAVKNEWGYVTNQQFVTNAFDNTAASRANQDVGLDGVPNEKETATFTNYLNALPALTPEAKLAIEKDPSGDDFHSFLGDDFDQNKTSILKRYKQWNGMDGNSPIASSTDKVSRSGSNLPENEDLNADNTLSELEEYYEYDMDMAPGKLDIGQEYIVDKIDARPENVPGDVVTWYLYRIPVKQFERKFGNINGFKSVRYVRMVLTGFKEPVVLRMANFRMIGSKWRRFTGQLQEGGLTEAPEPNLENFTVSVVNLEENAQGNANKSPYRIPPGVVRDRDNTTIVNRKLNEQSVQLCVNNLIDGDGRAIYKNTESDLFNYGRIKMYLHANSDANDDELRAFLRLGTDFDQNYYEIEVPLKITRPANTEDLGLLWPAENEIDLDLDELLGLKTARDRDKFPLNELYPRSGPKQSGKHLIRIFGRPDLSSVRVMMIGVRNPRSSDKRPYSICLWANELRLTDFNRTPGWAANAVLNTRLADFATITGMVRHTTFGFGGVNSKISQRAREETTTFDVSANVTLDKLIPGNTGIRLPMYVSYENTTINPNYDPANPDLTLDAALKSFNTDQERGNYIKMIRDESVRRSLNFTNVRKVKVKPDAKTHLWDIENLSFSYAYSEMSRKSFNIEESKQLQYRGSVNYAFSPKGVGIEPFKDFKALKSPYLKLIKDFNFSLLPSSIMVRMDLDRSFNKNVYRNSFSDANQSNFLKYFIFNRQYSLRWNLSKGLGFEYSARANAIVDEPKGEIDTKENQDSVWVNLKRFGRMKNFDQNFTVNYTLPLDKLPLTNWVGADYRYQASYNWKAGPVNLPDSLNFGNLIQNSRDQNFSGRLDLVKLYNKVKFLKEINTPQRPKPQIPARPGAPNALPQRPQAQPPQDTAKTTPALLKGLFRLVMSLRSINATYTKNQGTILPGFNVSPYLFGMDHNFSAPGWGFVLGDQDPNIRHRAADPQNNWLVRSRNLTNPFSQIQNTNLSIRANIDPSPDMKIQVDFRKDLTETYQEIFRFDEGTQSFESMSPNRSGSYKISTLTIKTAFEKTNSDKESKVFQTFEENLAIIQNRFTSFTGIEYDTASQDVLIPAFITAYTGANAHTSTLSPFPNMPMPNWRIDYSGLSKVPGFKEIFQSVTLTHSYSSAYSVMNYSNSLQYKNTDQIGLDKPIEDYNHRYYGEMVDGKIIPVYIISQVMLSEQFAPLIGMSVRTKSRLTANFQYKTKRDLALNVSNAQITEVNNKDVSFEFGFTKNNFKLPFKIQGRTMVIKNDVTFRMNVTLGDNKTIQRKIHELNIVTNGNKNFQLRPNLTYQVNQKLSIQAYFEHTVNDPRVSNSYRRATTRFGIQLRFSLAQ